MNQKLYENKKYPKGLKSAEKLLETNKNHPGNRHLTRNQGFHRFVQDVLWPQWRGMRGRSQEGSHGQPQECFLLEHDRHDPKDEQEILACCQFFPPVSQVRSPEPESQERSHGLVPFLQGLREAPRVQKGYPPGRSSRSVQLERIHRGQLLGNIC